MDASAKAKPIIGLAGGIGSGKSTVAWMLGELGAAVISSDQLNARELETPQVVSELRNLFGQQVLGSTGQLDRTAIRRILAEDPQARRRLEAVLHPRIAQRRLELTQQFQRDPQVRAIVWDSPLLYEAGLDQQCDAVIFVEVDDAIRAQRVLRDRGWTAQELERLEKAQKPLDFKRNSADHRVVNNSDRDALRPQVEAVFSRILSGA
jgi:dephospho-CoA kinase